MQHEADSFLQSRLYPLPLSFLSVRIENILYQMANCQVLYMNVQNSAQLTQWVV